MVTIIYYFLSFETSHFQHTERESFTRAQLLFSFLYKHEKELDIFCFALFPFKNKEFIDTLFHAKFTRYKEEKKKKKLSTRGTCEIRKVQSFRKKKEEIEHIHSHTRRENTYSRFRKI